MKLSLFLEKLEEDINRTKKAVEQKDRLEEIKNKFRVYDEEDALISSRDIASKIKNQPEEEKMHTGISGVDSILDGFRLDQLITVSGSTGSGKTTFSMELTIRLKDYSPVWIPFEEGAEELVRKFLERGETPPLFYTPKNITGNKIDWIEQRIIEGKVKFNSKIFFIDHLHFIVPFTGERHDLSVGKTMRELKQIAKKWNVCIFIICHLKKVGVDKLPTLDSLRDSSFIGQESDTVIMIWRSPYKGQENYSKVGIQKNRRTGKLGVSDMYFDGGRYYEKAIPEPELKY